MGNKTVDLSQEKARPNKDWTGTAEHGREPGWRNPDRLPPGTGFVAPDLVAPDLVAPGLVVSNLVASGFVVSGPVSKRAG